MSETMVSVPGVIPAVREAYSLLPPTKRRKFLLVIVIQVLTSLLDVVGVLLMAAVGVLSVQVVQGSSSGTGVLEPIVSRFAAAGFDLKQTTLIFASGAAVFLVFKSLVSSLLSRRVLLFLATQQAQLSSSLIARLLQQSVTEIQNRSSLTTAYAIVQGATSAVVGVLGSAATVISESALLLLIAVTLLWINPVITIFAMLFLVTIGFVIYRLLGNWSERAGRTTAQTAMRGNVLVQDTVLTFREIRVLDRTSLYVNQITDLLTRGSRSQADTAFIGQLPKFVFESALIVGSLLLAGFLILTSDAVTAVGTMVLFLAAGSRVLPSIMRLQGSVITIRSSAGSSMATFELARLLENVPTPPADGRTVEEIEAELTAIRASFVPTIELVDATFTYPGAPAPALNHITHSVASGASLALVGMTGSGKSTLSDALLGVITPQTGTVRIGGLNPLEAIKKWPGGIAYVPQHVALVDGTVRDNVALGLPRSIVDDDAVWRALAQAHLDGFLSEQRDGIDTVVGERGVRLSGGQRQRLGLARALFTVPSLLVLDEATSALDAETEVLISDVIHSLHGRVTLVVVAHRLATVREFDQVAYLEEGRMVCIGSFDEVRAAVPSFDRQASLLGL